MKLTALLVFLGFLILPTVGMVSLILYKLFTRGTEGVDSLYKPSPTIQRLRSRPKLYYSVLGAYGLLFFASLMWAFYELFGDALLRSLDLSPRELRQVIVIGAFAIIVFGGLVFGGLFALAIRRPVQLAIRAYKKYPPPQNAGYTSSEFWEWKKNYYRETDKYYADPTWVRKLLLSLLLVPVAVGLFVLFSWLIVTFLP